MCGASRRHALPGDTDRTTNGAQKHVKVGYMLSDLAGPRKNDKKASNPFEWIKSDKKEKGDLEKDSYKILSQIY